MGVTRDLDGDGLPDLLAAESSWASSPTAALSSATAASMLARPERHSLMIDADAIYSGAEGDGLLYVGDTADLDGDGGLGSSPLALGTRTLAHGPLSDGAPLFRTIARPGQDGRHGGRRGRERRRSRRPPDLRRRWLPSFLLGLMIAPPSQDPDASPLGGGGGADGDREPGAVRRTPVPREVEGARRTVPSAVIGAGASSRSPGGLLNEPVQGLLRPEIEWAMGADAFSLPRPLPVGHPSVRGPRHG